MKKFKVTIIILAIICVVSVVTSIHFANELNQEKQSTYVREQTTINNYQASFANATHRLELKNTTPSDLLHAIEQLNSSMQDYESVSKITESMEYDIVIDAYISALEDYVLANTNGETTNFAYDIENIYSDLIIIGDWLRERNESDILVAHNDDDFYEIYLKLSSEVINDIGVYVE
ncbi:MAG: hypothetical protein R3Y47_12000 [Lachnospiraceae bacterium]